MNANAVVERLSIGRGAEVELDPEPTSAEIRAEVRRLKAEGLCGRRVGEDHLVPYFLGTEGFGQPEIDLLEDVLAEEYADSDTCLRTRRSRCSRLRGGCQGSR